MSSSAITEPQITAWSDGHGNIVLTDGVAGDQILLDGMMSTPGDGISKVQFADGSSITAAQLILMATTGTAGADALIGGPGSEVFDGKGGADYEQGNGGNDTFVFNSGYGGLEINETGSTGAVLQLGSSIASTSLAGRGDGRGDLILSDGTTGDAITIDGMMSSSAWGVDSVQFANGASWTRAQLLNLATTGTMGSDRLYGSAESQVFDGKGGADYEQGNSGSDNFVFANGYGALEISESQLTRGSYLQLTGITQTALRAYGTATGNLVLTDATPRDQITLDGMLTSVQNGIQGVEFGGGLSYTRAQLINLATTGTTGADTLYGSSEADVFDGKGGNDYEQGNGGDDTFLFSQSYGTLEINEVNGTNSFLQLSSGITSTQITLTNDGSGNLLLTDGGDRIKLDNMLGSTTSGVSAIEFATGSTWAATQIRTAVANSAVPSFTFVTGSSSSDTLVGTSGPQTFDGEGGGDLERGAGGADSFIYNAGYGQLEINEGIGSGAANTSRLVFGPGITASNIQVSEDASNNIYITDGVAGDRIKLDNMLARNETNALQNGVSELLFSDGTTRTYQQIINLVTTGTSSGETLYGGGGAETFDGGGGNDLQIGGGGDDTFIYRPGYGHLEINESASGSATGAILQLLASSGGSGTIPSQVTITSNAAGTIFLTDRTSGDQVQIDGMANLQSGVASFGVSEIHFTNGTVWYQQQILDMATTGTSNGQTLYGGDGGDTFDSKGLAHFEVGRGLSDTFIYRAGYGNLEITENSPGATGSVLELQVSSSGSAILPSQVLVTSDNAGDIILTDGITNDRLQIDNMANLRSGVPTYGVSEIEFSNGTVWNRQQVLDLATTGTSNADTLYGSASGDTFDGKGGTDTEIGRSASDVFVYKAGYGALTIQETLSNIGPNGTILQISGVNESQIGVASDASGTIHIAGGISTDRITIIGMADSYSGFPIYGIGGIQFADGTVWDRQQVFDLATTGTNNSDTLYGSAFGDTFDGKGGLDTEIGQSNSDVFVYKADYGKLTIQETLSNIGPNGTVLQISGISESQIGARSDASGTIHITDGISTDGITIQGMADSYSGYPIYGIGEIEFADGTVWGRQQIFDLATTGTSNSETLYGSAFGDTFDGKGGTDKEIGQSNLDTFIYKSGYGSLDIQETLTSIGSNNTILALGAGITETNIVVTYDGAGNIYLADGRTGDSVKIDNMENTYSGYPLNGVGEIQFSDGTVWSRQQVLNAASPGSGGNAIRAKLPVAAGSGADPQPRTADASAHATISNLAAASGMTFLSAAAVSSETDLTKPLSASGAGPALDYAYTAQPAYLSWAQPEADVAGSSMVSLMGSEHLIDRHVLGLGGQHH